MGLRCEPRTVTFPESKGPAPRSRELAGFPWSTGSSAYACLEEDVGFLKLVPKAFWGAEPLLHISSPTSAPFSPQSTGEYSFLRLDCPSLPQPCLPGDCSSFLQSQL